jgi:hypothetical protein
VRGKRGSHNGSTALVPETRGTEDGGSRRPVGQPLVRHPSLERFIRFIEESIRHSSVASRVEALPKFKPIARSPLPQKA